ncbi:MAG: FAD-binding oxidoreductase [Azospirillaceae bacterium]
MTALPHAPSWYAATAPVAQRYDVLDGDARVDVAIVGAGFTGLSAALELAARGLRVAVLESHYAGWGASGRNGGQIVTGYNKEMSTIARMVGREAARELWAMNEEAKGLIHERVARHRIDCELKPGYVFAAAKQSHVEDLKASLEEWHELGYTQAHLVGAKDVPKLVNTNRYYGAVIDSGSGQLHPLKYALGLARAARDAGAAIYEETEVTRLDTGSPNRLATARGTVTADHVILAGNAYLPGLSPAVSRQVRSRVMPVATYIIATEELAAERAAALIPSGFAIADVNFVLNYYRLSSDHRMLFGGRVSYSGYHRPGLAALLKKSMTDLFPSLADTGIDYCWGGNVAITINRLPHLGRLTPTVYFAQGFSGHGVALTGMAGRVMAEAVAGQAGRFDVFAAIRHRPFPGGRLFRMPLLVLAMAWYRLKDRL